MNAYALQEYTSTQRQRTCTAHTYAPPGTDDAIFEVYRPVGALEERIAYARGDREDVEAFYAAQVPGTIKLRQIQVQTVTSQMAQRAVDRSLRGIMGLSIESIAAQRLN